MKVTKPNTHAITVARNSNIELLRIICIFFVILRHYSTQVGWGEFTADAWTWRILFLQVIRIGGSTANNIFLLISGYYMIGRKVKYKRIVALIVEMFFYSWATLLFLCIFRIIPISARNVIEAISPIWFGYNWYICCYVIFCCFLPFLNPLFDSLSKNVYKSFLMISVLIWSFAYTFGAKTYLGTDFSVDHFVIMYAVGGYIKKYGFVLKRHTWKYHFIASSILLVLSVVALSYGGALLGWDSMVSKAEYFSEATNIVDVVVSVTLFLWVINKKPFYSRIINRLAKSVIGIFLIHHNPLLKVVIWQKLSPNTDYLNSNFLPLHCLAKVCCVFVICLVIDQVRLSTVDKKFVATLNAYWSALVLEAKRVRRRFARVLPFE